LEGWKFEDAIWMHRKGHNVKIGNKKKQEKLQENVYLATDLVFQPLFAHCMTPPPQTKCPITHQWNQNWIQYNLQNQMTTPYQNIKLHGLSYPNRWVGCVSLKRCKSKGLNCFYNTSERGHHTRKWMIETQRMLLLGIIPTLEFWQLWTTPYSSSWL
jgi:hypothetical protein